MNTLLKTVLKVVAFASIGFVVLWLVYRSNNAAYQEECIKKGIALSDCNLIQKVIEDMKSANYLWIFMALLFFFLSNISRTLRWAIILEPLGYKPKFINSLGAILIGYLANLGLPRSGEFVRAGVLSRYEGYTAEKVMGTIVLDRIADVLMLLVTIGIAMLLSFNDVYGYISQNSSFGEKVQLLLNPITIIGLIVLAALSFFILNKYNRQIRNTTIGGKLFGILDGLKEGVMSITKLKRPWAFVFHSVFIWVCYFIMNWVGFYAFEPTSHLGPLAGLVVFVFGSIGIVVPSPGGMGSYHFLVGEGLALYGVNEANAFSFANIVFFSVQLFSNILLGIVALIVLPIYNSKKTPSA